MKKLIVVQAVISMICAVSCATSEGSKASAPKTAASVRVPQSEVQQPSRDAAVDCDDFMKQLSDGCYVVTAFEEDNETPRHLIDEAGNDLGEIDREWASSYCECYAQLAFQTFGCTAVISHEELDDDAYARTYDPIVAACDAEYAGEN